MFKTIKLYVYTAIAAVFIASFFWYGHSRYEAGKAFCVNAALAEQAKKVPAALANADKARQDLDTIEDTNSDNLVEIKKASTSCAPSADELLIFNKAVKAANDRSSSSSGKVQSSARNKRH